MYKFFYCPDTLQVHALEGDGTQDSLIRPGWISKTENEAADLLAVSRPDDRRGLILSELAAIDAASARPLRACVIGVATDEDRARLAELEARAAKLRADFDALPSSA